MVVGDMTDANVVADAVAGCDAVLHAAAIFSSQPRDSKEMAASNARGAEVVLGTATVAGCDPVVPVSTFSALLPSTKRLTPDNPVGAISTP